MKQIKLWSLLVLAGLTGTKVWAQEITASIPYRMLGGKMVIDWYVNGERQPFVFDTGAKTTITASLSQSMQLTVLDTLHVKDANNQPVAMPRVLIKQLATPDKKIAFSQARVAVTGDDLLACFGAKGLIGNDLFQGCIVKIDSRSHLIEVRAAATAVDISIRNMVTLETDIPGYPIFQAAAGEGQTIKVLFDTGSSSLLYLKDTDAALLESAEAAVLHATGEGSGAISVGGVAKPQMRKRLLLPAFQIGIGKFRGIITEAGDAPYSLLGTKLLDYGMVTIDFSRHRFYYEPFSPEPVATLKPSWNLDMQVKEGLLTVGAVWGDLKGVVHPGDRILKINGQPAPVMSFCESITTGLPQLKNNNRLELLIQTASGEKTLTINKQS